MDFQLHPRLKQDCINIGKLRLCRVLLMNDQHYPWFILVPEIAEITEIYQLKKADQIQLVEESSLMAETIMQQFSADKINIATIGNKVPQLHVHHIARYQTDIAWPAPVWGKVDSVSYSPQQEKALLTQMKKALQGSLTE